MKYRIYKKRILRNLYRTNNQCRSYLCSLTFKILPVSIILLTAFLLIYISFISTIIINNVQKISLEKENIAIKDEITELEITILQQKQTLNKENVLSMGYKETQDIKYLSANKTASAILSNEI